MKKNINNNFNISPSILSADFSNVKTILNDLKDIGINIVHFDVMDNHFVPNLTFGHKFIKDLRKDSDLFFDAHLMIESPEKWIDNYIKAGADNITFHIESTSDAKNIIKKIKDAGISCGISIKPKTPVKMIEEYISMIDLVLVMTVEPGFGGQKMMRNTLHKIKELDEIRKSKSYNIKIEADGGINKENIHELINMGLDIAVMGSAFFKSNNKKKLYDEIMGRI